MAESTESVNAPFFRVVWRCADAATERDVLAFWREHKLLPVDADAAKRLRDICVVAWDVPRVVGVIEAEVRYLDAVRAKIAMIKLAVATDHRKTKLSSYLSLFGCDAIEIWANDHPEEKVMGLGSILQVVSSSPYLKEAFLPRRSQFGVVSHTQRGEQVRLSWFKHATID
jgi:hypothetical protein